MADPQDDAFQLMLNKAAGLMNYNFLEQAHQVEQLMEEVVKDHNYFSPVKVKRLLETISKSSGVGVMDLRRLLKESEFKFGSMDTSHKFIGKHAATDKAFNRFLNENQFPIMTNDQILDHVVAIIRSTNGDYGDDRMKGLPPELHKNHLMRLCRKYFKRIPWLMRQTHKQLQFKGKKTCPWILDEKLLDANRIRVHKELNRVPAGKDVYKPKGYVAVQNNPLERSV